MLRSLAYVNIDERHVLDLVRFQVALKVTDIAHLLYLTNIHLVLHHGVMRLQYELLAIEVIDTFHQWNALASHLDFGRD